MKVWKHLIQHDAHHRGQICMLVRDLGHTFSGGDGMRMWGWKKDLCCSRVFAGFEAFAPLKRQKL